MSSNMVKLSRIVSHALRHAPQEYRITLDQNGWVNICELLHALAAKSSKWNDLQIHDIHALLAAGEKQRFEIRGDDIRAIYGHSIEQQVKHDPVIPPEVLYHGTTPAAWAVIEDKGLKPMQRQYVHLSPDIETATVVARRRTSDPVMLQVDAKQAHCDGKSFYCGNEKVWLTEFIEPNYLTEIS